MTESSAEPPVRFIDLPPERFPFRIECVAVETGAVVREITVPGPGAVLIPALAAECGPVRVRVTWGDGTVTETAP